MNTPFNPGGAQAAFNAEEIPTHLRDGKTAFTSERHDLEEAMEREEVIEARKMLNRMVEDKATSEAAVLIACEILSRHAVNRESDFTAVTEVNPKYVDGRKDVRFEIRTQMTVGGKA